MTNTPDANDGRTGDWNANGGKRDDSSADRKSGDANADETLTDGGVEGLERRPKTLGEIRDVYADQADTMARMSWLNRLLTGRYRRKAFGSAAGRVLDVACGMGTNRRYLSDAVDYVGIDLSPDMLDVAERQYDDLERGESLFEMDAQDLAFPDDSFDVVISSLSTCTFPDPDAALREMGRVAEPDGRILLFEHGRSSVGPIARFQEWRADAHYEKHGCRWTQEPVEVVESAGLDVLRSSTAVLGILTLIEARPLESDGDSSD